MSDKLIEMTDAEFKAHTAKIREEAQKEQIKKMNFLSNEKDKDTSFKVTDYISAIYTAKNGDKGKALDNLNRKLDDTGNINYDFAVKQLMATDGTAGGYMVPTEFIAELIPQVYAASPLLDRLQRVDISSGSARIPKETLKPTFYDVGENDAITETSTTYGDINFEAKETAGLIGLSNKLIRRSGLNTEQMVVNSLINGLAEHIQKRILKGSGSSSQVLGLYSQAATAQKFDSAGDTLANITDDLVDALNKIQNNNHALTNGLWLMPTKHYNKVMTIRNTLGLTVFENELRQGTLYGQSVAATNAMTALTEVYLIDLDAILMGVAKDMELIIEPYANYTDSDGNQVNGFQKDITGIRVSMEYDVKTKYDTGLSVIESVSWGA